MGRRSNHAVTSPLIPLSTWARKLHRSGGLPSTVTVEAEDGARKRYRITAEGEAVLTANRAAADELLARKSESIGDIPATVMRAMENLKLAMRLRFRQGPLEREAAENIAAVLDAAAKAVETS